MPGPSVSDNLCGLGFSGEAAGYMAETFTTSPDTNLSPNPVTSTSGTTQSLAAWTQDIEDIINGDAPINADDATVIATGTNTSASLSNRFAREIDIRDMGASSLASNNATAIQSAITLAAATGARVLIPGANYITGSLTIPSNVTISGVRGASVITAIASLADNATLLANTTPSSYANSNIVISDLIIDGNGVGGGMSQTRLTELVSFVRVTGLHLSGVTVRNVEYIGMALAGCHDVNIDDCEFTDCGYDGTTTNGGSALWVANRVSDSSTGVVVTNTYFHDNRWHGTHFSAYDGAISDCRFEDNEEAAIFAPVANSGKRSFTNNKINGVVIRDISASGIEVGGTNVVISGNQITATAGSAVALTDAQDILVQGNVFTACEKMGVHIVTTVVSPNQPQDITITGNRITDDGQTCLTAIKVTNAGDNVTGVTIANNDIRGTWADGAAIITNSKVGADSRIEGNIGYNPVGSNNITVGSSPYTYTAGLSPETVYIRGGTVSAIAIGAGPVTVFTSTDRTIELGPLERVIVTYSGLPTMVSYTH